MVLIECRDGYHWYRPNWIARLLVETAITNLADTDSLLVDEFRDWCAVGGADLHDYSRDEVLVISRALQFAALTILDDPERAAAAVDDSSTLTADDVTSCVRSMRDLLGHL